MYGYDRPSSEKNSKYQLLYPYGVPPDDGLQMRPKHVDVFDEISSSFSILSDDRFKASFKTMPPHGAI